VCFTSGNGVSNMCAACFLHVRTRARLPARTHTDRNISAQIFRGYCGRKPKHGPQWHQTEKVDQNFCLLKCKVFAWMSSNRHKKSSWLGDFMSDCVWNACCTAVIDSFSTPAEHTNSFISGVPFSSLVASAENNKLGHFKQKFISVPTDAGDKM
jgi:hypothetical protein